MDKVLETPFDIVQSHTTLQKTQTAKAELKNKTCISGLLYCVELHHTGELFSHFADKIKRNYFLYRDLTAVSSQFHS